MPDGATILDPVGTAPGLVVPPASANGGPTVVVLPGPPRELQEMWPAAAAADTFAAAIAGRDHVPAAHAAPVRHPRVRDRRDAAGGRGRRPGARRAGDHDVPAPRGARGGDPVRAGVRGGLPGVRGGRPRAPRRHAVLDRRLDGRRAGRRAAALPRLDDRDGRVLHGRPARRPPDGPGGLVGLRAGRPRRVLQRGEDGARGRPGGPDRAGRGGVGRGRRGAGRRRAGARRRRRRGRDHRHRRPWGRDGRRSPSASSASRWPGRTSAASRARRGCRAGGATCATARPRSRCTLSGGCCATRPTTRRCSSEGAPGS